MNRSTKTWTVNVNISCLHPIMQEIVRLSVVQHVLYFMNRVGCTSSLLCSPPPSPDTLLMDRCFTTVERTHRVMQFSSLACCFGICPTARCGGNLTSVERARWHVVSSGAKVGCWKPSRRSSRLVPKFQREHWPAFTIQNLLVNAEAENTRLISRARPSSDPVLDEKA